MHRKGFTLVELLLVLLVVALVAAIVVPLLRRPGSAHEARLAAAELALLCREARQEARRTGRDHGVLLAATARRTTAMLRSRDAVGAIVRPERPTQPVHIDAAVACSVDGRPLAAGDEAAVWFVAVGPAADAVIRLGDDERTAPRVVIGGWSGLIRQLPGGRAADPPASVLESFWEAQCRTLHP
ncbi:MAG: prepilin-type N-terminal cleavage/methylation domain-containing protein [Planctomycetes bacterium]|nr:prepilin-type N-terminal cleavage/methylation domain-containing protein [Planctomycetota bacterium]